LSAKHDIKKLLPVAKKSRQYGWLKEADSIALQQACLNLDHAFQRFFDPVSMAIRTDPPAVNKIDPPVIVS
jgi:putative transposase